MRGDKGRARGSQGAAGQGGRAERLMEPGKASVRWRTVRVRRALAVLARAGSGTGRRDKGVGRHPSGLLEVPLQKRPPHGPLPAPFVDGCCLLTPRGPHLTGTDASSLL